MDYNHRNAIVLSDLKGNITYFDGGAEEFFGYSAANVTGASLDTIIPHFMREGHWNGFMKGINENDGKGGLSDIVTNVPVLCEGGSIREFRGRFGYIQDPGNNIIGAQAVYTPIEMRGSSDACGGLKLVQ